MQFDASIQNGIVMYLSGSTYSATYALDLDLALREKSDDRLQEVVKTHVKEFFRKADDTLVDNGMPTRCFGCTHCNKSEISTYQNERDLTQRFSQGMKCEIRGCDKARKDFIDNFDRLDERDRHIQISVDFESFNVVSMESMGGTTKFLAPKKSDQISIIARPIERKAKRGFIANALNEEDELKEIGELFDLGLIAPKDQPANYGEVTW